MKKILNSFLLLLITAGGFAQVVRDYRGEKNSAKPVASISYEVFLYENTNYDGRFELVKPGASGDGN